MSATGESLPETHSEAVARLSQLALDSVQRISGPTVETADIVGDVTQIGD